MCKMGITRRALLDIKFFIIFFLKFLENFAVSPCIFLWQCLLLTCMSFLCDLVFCLQMQKHFSNIYSIYWRWQFKTNFFRYMVSFLFWIFCRFRFFYFRKFYSLWFKICIQVHCFHFLLSAPLSPPPFPSWDSNYMYVGYLPVFLHPFLFTLILFTSDFLLFFS